jgi:hypothetical protein
MGATTMRFFRVTPRRLSGVKSNGIVMSSILPMTGAEISTPECHAPMRNRVEG